MYYLLLPDLETRQRLIDHLKSVGILAVFHYLPLNRSRMAERLKATNDCPVAENVSDRLLRLPFSSGLSPNAQRRVIDAVLSFR